LGFNPLRTLLGPSGALQTLPKAGADALTSTHFIPQLISGPLHDGLVLVVLTAAAMMAVGAVASWLAGGQFVHDDGPSPTAGPTPEREAVPA